MPEVVPVQVDVPKPLLTLGREVLVAALRQRGSTPCALRTATTQAFLNVFSGSPASLLKTGTSSALCSPALSSRSHSGTGDTGTKYGSAA